MERISLWASRNFRLLFTASAASNLGDGLVAVAVPWLATLLTRDPLLIGLVAAARQAPWALMSLPAGVLADRHDRRRLLIAADAARIAAALALVVLALLAPPGTAAALVLALLAFVLGCAEVLHDNTAQSFLPAVVAKDRLEDGNGTLWAAEQVMNQFAGPPLAGILIGTSIAAPFGLNAAVLAGAIALVTQMRLPKAEPAPHKPFGPAIREGLAFLWQHESLRRMALALGAFNFIGSIFWALVVLYAQEVLGLDATGYGLLMAAAALGGFAGSLLGPRILRRIGQKTGLLCGVAGFSVASAVLGFSTNLWLVGAVLLLDGFGNMLWNLTSVSYRQRHIPEPLLGRVNSVYRFIGTGPSALGSLAGGAIVALGAPLGPVGALQLPYALCLGGAALIFAYVALALQLD